MKWPSRRLRWRAFFSAFLLYSLVLLLHFWYMRSLPSEIATPPSYYQYVLFPRGEVLLHETEDLDPHRIAGVLDRAVGGSQDEIAFGVVGVNIPPSEYVYASTSKLAFLPESEDYRSFVQGWQEEGCPGSRCDWEAELLDNGNRLVRLSREIRTVTRHYSYETDGERLIHVYAIVSGHSFIDLLFEVGAYLTISLVTLALCQSIFRGAPTDMKRG